MRDIGHEETDKLIEQLEKKITREYSQAEKELQAKLDDYFRRFSIKDQSWQKMVANGEKTAEEYQKWRVSQMMVGENWKAMRETIAEDMHNANALARGMVAGDMPLAWATNANWATYQIEHDARVNTGFTLYNHDSAMVLLKDEPELLKPPGKQMQRTFDEWDAYRAGQSVDLSPEKQAAFDKLIAKGKDIRWQEGQIQSITLQSILQGESIPNMTKRIAETLGEINHKSTIRYARTAMTSAQEQGRSHAYQRAEDMGIDLKREWRAVFDMRTRHAHRQLDGQLRGIDEPFEVDGEEIMFPGDPAAAGYLIYNCRCRTTAAVKGWDKMSRQLRSDEAVGGMSYDEWKEGHSQPQPIDKQEKVSEAMRQKTIRKVYGGKGGGKEPSFVTEQTTIPEKTFSFIPATSIEEAEAYAQTFTDKSHFGATGVSYKGVSVDVANEVNRTIGRFYETFDVEKFGGVIAPAGNTKYGKAIQNATAAYNPINRSFLLNRQSLKNMKTASAALQAEQNAIANILAHPERYDLSRASSMLRRVVENSRLSGRATIPTTIEDAVNHELGHSLERQIAKHPLWEQAKENMPDFNQGLSGYACENKSEYIAESFCSYMKGENKCDPVLIQIFDSFRRK